jgi:iron-sulfur cluster repair protein YtfE (RIC family)
LALNGQTDTAPKALRTPDVTELNDAAEPDALGLERRTGLPDALRVLVEELPRDRWEGHQNFAGLTRFWLQRHLMFRQILEMLISEAQAFHDRRTDPAVYAPRLSRLAGIFFGQLHEHHKMEDAHYFPKLKLMDRRVVSGFAVLDRDHVALDSGLHQLLNATNVVLNQVQTQREGQIAGAELEQALSSFSPLLNRHLIDEEEIVVPIILINGVG